MNTTTLSSFGHIIEFNRETGVGLIQEDTTQRVLPVHYNNFKKHSKRYLTEDKKFMGELFDFDLVVKQKSDDNGSDTWEIVSVRHRVLKCNVEGCSRIKAFTNVKALEDHINIRHTLKKKQEEITSPSLSTSVKKSKKQRRSRPKPIIIKLSSSTAAATVGRFIGKQGVNLKRLEQLFQVKLQLLDSRKVFQSVQILIKPNTGVTINVELISKKLKSDWARCVREQEESEKTYQQQLRSLKYSFTAQLMPEFESDSRYRDDLKFRLRRLKREEYLGKRRCRQTESSVRVQERHSSLNQEGHRSAATCATELRQKSIFNYYQPKKTKNNAKEQYWLVDEDLLHLEQPFVAS
ncbi:unnamed protein product [Rotaria sp. Silwood1]|nr:unnamed protein product [Rotaria sp. Silwood1]